MSTTAYAFIKKIRKKWPKSAAYFVFKFSLLRGYLTSSFPSTVKPLLSKHQGKVKKWLLKRGVCLKQVNLHLSSLHGT